MLNLKMNRHVFHIRNYMNSHVREDARKNYHVREDTRNLRLLDSTMEYMFNRKIMMELMHWFVPTLT